VAHLYLIAWRFIITDFYQLNYNTELLPLRRGPRAYSIYTRALERYTTLVMAKAYKVRVMVWHGYLDTLGTPTAIESQDHDSAVLFL